MLPELELEGWFLPREPGKNAACPAVQYGNTDVGNFADDEIETTLATVAGFSSLKKEERRYKAFTLLLNLISRAWRDSSARSRKGRDTSLVFTCTGNRPPTDDWLKCKAAPDFLSFESDAAQLDEVIKDCRNPAKTLDTFPLPRYVDAISPAELKVKKKFSLHQLTTYLSSVKRYRPDLDTVYGFQVDNGLIRVAALNACGLWHSTPLPVRDIRPWVAFVSAAYYSLDHRNTTMTLVKELNTFQCWNVKFQTDEYVASVVPIHVGTAVGRTTYATLELAEPTKEEFLSGEVKGFLKTSWQDTRARSKESEMLKRIHRDKYLPGVVRLRHADLGKGVSAPRVEDSQRRQEIIHLGSVGEPLSQIISLRHWLFAAYDTIESHLLLCEEGVLHRDLSWANCLVFPRHLVGDDKPEKDRPCIAAIVAELGIKLSPEASKLGLRTNPVNGKRYEPCALITDFDHAAEIEEYNKRRNSGCHEWTGTPMFIACELADPTIDIGYNDAFLWEDLQAGLMMLEGSPAGRAALKASGLDKETTFMPSFLVVVEQEKARRRKANENDTPHPVNETQFHEWRHDCESVFWWLLWGVARAHPRDPSKFGSDTTRGPYNMFCRDMLGHVIGDETTEARRVTYLFAVHLRNIWHPAFAGIKQLFRDIATYISIPWFLYTNDAEVGLKENHAHVAFRRLILAWAIREDIPFLDVLLNTERPRFADLGRFMGEKHTTSSPSCSATSASTSTATVTPQESQTRSRGTHETYVGSCLQRGPQRNRGSQGSNAQSAGKKSVSPPPLFSTSGSRSRPATPSGAERSVQSDTSGTRAINVLANACSQKRSRALSSVWVDDRPTKKPKPDESEKDMMDCAVDGDASGDEIELKKVSRRDEEHDSETDSEDGSEADNDEPEGKESKHEEPKDNELENGDSLHDAGEPSENDTGNEHDVNMAETYADIADVSSVVDTSHFDHAVRKALGSLHHEYSEDLHPNKSVHALRLKFWKDIAYWFGPGE